MVDGVKLALVVHQLMPIYRRFNARCKAVVPLVIGFVSLVGVSVEGQVRFNDCHHVIGVGPPPPWR